MNTENDVIKVSEGLSMSPGAGSYYISSITYVYVPQSDITTYELAQIIPYLMGKLMYEKDWEKLGTATRHLKRQ